MNVVIIDDDKLVCSALKTILESNAIKVVGIGHGYDDAISLYFSVTPDIILMDIRIGEKTGIDAAVEILKKDSLAKVLFLTTFADDEYIIKAISMKAKGYILKQDFENIVPALNSVFSGQSVFGSDIITRIPDYISHEDIKLNLNKYNLDEKEIQIIKLVATGLSNKDIAINMFFTEGTIRNYISAIMEKLNMKSRTQLVVFYYTNKIP